MTERESLAREVAGDQFGLTLEDDNGSRQYQNGRLREDERKAFDAGWEAAKQYYTNESKVTDVQS